MEKIIGYQIISKDRTEMPDCFWSFEVFADKGIAQKWLDLEKLNPEHGEFRWKLVPVFEGEVEEPTFIEEI